MHTHTHTQRYATERNNTSTPRLETHTVSNTQPTHQLHPKNNHTTTHTHTTHGTRLRKYNMNIYIVANTKAFNLIDPNNIQNTMNKALTQAYGYSVKSTLIDTTKLDATNIDSSTSYKDTPILIQTHQTTTILCTKPHNRK